MRKDPLKNIIQSFGKDEKREFQAFINRQKVKKSRKDLELFNILNKSEDFKPSEIENQLYGKKNSNAYQSIRKRLMNHLMHFIVVKRMDDDPTAESRVLGLLSIARFLLERGKIKSGWDFLIKAENLAEQYELYGSLNNVIHTQIQFADTDSASAFEEIIQKKDKYQKLFEREERAEIASMEIKLILKKMRIEGIEINLQDVLFQTMEKYDLDEMSINRPKILYQLMTMIRSSIVASKTYYQFEDIVIDQYERINEKEGFQKKDHYQHLSLLYMISHVLYRNRKFEKSLEYLARFEEELLNYNQSFFSVFYAKWLQLKAAIKSYSGHNEESIVLIEEGIEQNADRIDASHLLNMKLNLGVYYFQNEDYKMCNKTLYQIQHTDNWLQKKKGKEWVLRKNLIEIITQYELGNVDIAMNRIKSFKKAHEKILKNNMYQRVITFLGFVEDFIKNPEKVSQPEYLEHVNNTLDRWPIKKEDIQAMAFYCWLKSKMQKRKYYEVVIEAMQMF